ncbi:MAG: histidine kinase [Bacteroidetes bacterium]|nr:histidine kinase [Bacteroidota bacterium]
MLDEARTDFSAAIIAGTILFLLLLGFVLFFFLWFRKKRQLDNVKMKEMRMDAERMQAKYQQTLLQTQLEIQEQTLKNISQEIHDNVGQVLSLAKLNLNMMDVEKPDQLQRKIQSTLGQVTKAINDLRDLSKSFNTDNIVALGLIQSIAGELDIVSKTDKFKTEFRIAGNSVLLEAQKELILFRIVQEALHNVIKHARATVIRVYAEYTPEQLALRIEDDGRGFAAVSNQEGVVRDQGLGIRNMHNRAKMIGADFSLQSAVGHGTSVKIVVPLSGHTPAVN